MTVAWRPLAAMCALVAIIAAGCSSAPPAPTPTSTPADGATTHEVLTTDGHTLTARLWHVDPDRVAIYLHEYREEQSAWWPFATAARRLPVSAITFDFRGHGVSSGLPDDVAGMLEDAHAVIAFARSRGYTQIMLVGAGMGAAVAVSVAAEEPDLRVIGLSTPSAFDPLDTLTAITALEGRVALAAAAEDLSAAHSLGELAAVANLPDGRAQLYPGRAHGVDMLSETGGAVARAYVEQLLTEFWPAPAAKPASTLR